MVESFGARLRQQREQQEIPLATIAARTKIKQSLFEALERDDVSRWPSGIFRRAYIRAYAENIGLNPEIVVREFLAAHPEPAEVVETAPAGASAINGTRLNGGAPTRLRFAMGSAVGFFSRRRRGPAAEDRPPGRSGEVGVQVPVVLDLRMEPPPPAEDTPIERTSELAITDCTPVNGSASPDPDFSAVARLCTEFGRVETTSEARPLLREAARLLDASGLIVWVWDETAGELRPALVHGYSDKVLAQLPPVRRDADNATAAAFRSAQTCAINGGDHANGALVVPLQTPAGCAGVLAIELRHGGEQIRSVRVVATIIAALLAQLIGARPAEGEPQAELSDPPVEDFTIPVRRASAGR